jgi:hypothetical protein
MYKTYGYINQNQLVVHLGRSNPNQAGSAAISYAKKALGVSSVSSTNNAGEEQLTDKNGTVWIYGKADAPDCINGKMVFAAGTSQSRKAL